MPPPLLLAPPPLLLVLALLVGCAAAAMDVAAQLQLLSGPLAPPAAPAELSGRLELELGGAKLSALSAALQRALLWDAGWLRLGGEDSEYVQVLVPCGSHMDAAVLDEGEVEGCVAESECRRPSGNASAWSCGDAEQVARCAVVVDGGEQLEIADNASWPLVAVDAVIDAGFDPQLLRFTGGADQTQVIVIASRGEWRTQGAFCLQGPLFVSPCVVLNATSSSRSSSSSGSSGSSSVSNTTGWCEPTRTSTVSAWLQSELEDLEHQVVATSSSSSSSSSDGDNDTPLLIGMIVAGVVLIAIISIPFCLAHRNQRKSRQQMAAPARRRCHEGATPSRSEPDQSLSASDFRLLTDR